MLRPLCALVPVLLIAACSDPSGPSGRQTEFVIDAPRREVFDSATKWSRFMAFRRLGNNPSRQQYEMAIDDDILIAAERREDAQPILDQFRGGKIYVRAERPDRVLVELRPPSDGRTLRYYLNFADGEAADSTQIHLKIDDSEGPLTPEQTKQMDQFLLLMSGDMGPRSLRLVEDEFEKPLTVSTMKEVEDSAGRRAIREGLRED